MKQNEKNWESVLSNLETLLNPASYNAWFSKLGLIKFDKLSGSLYLAVEQLTQKKRLEERYYSILKETVIDYFFPLEKIVFLLPDEEERLFPKKPSNENELFRKELMLNPKYTFASFIEGDNNQFAYKAALAVAESANNPLDNLNPLFIYGDSGLGKTHLMNAIGHYVFDHYPKMKVLFISSEMFTNDFINSSMKRKDENNKMDEFKKKYRELDILMIDDIQFISDKDRTREEVFNTFNSLYGMRKQLVFSSDRPPKNLLGMDERLISRLSQGLLVDLKPPAYEIKVAILRNKAIIEGIELTDGLIQVINIIAERVKSNIREMEGAFNRVVAYSTLSGSEVTERLAKSVLSDFFSMEEVRPSTDIIKKKVAKYYNIKVSDLESSKRARIFSLPRQIAMYLCREMIDISLPKIGEQFGNRDHTTVLHAVEKIEKNRLNDSSFNEVVKTIEEEIRNN
jgi:chromosomal replication initiator protein